MKRSESGEKRRRGAVPLAMLGVALGAGLAYALVAWRRALMPELQLQPGADGVSIYEVSGDVTRDWTDGTGPAGTDDAIVADRSGALDQEPAAGAAVEAAAGAEGDGEKAAGSLPEGDDEDVDHAPGRVHRNGLIDIEGIGPVYAQTLADLGLFTTADLLQAGANPKGREGLVSASGISRKLILRWVNQADLFRVKGVGEQYADLLEAAGVDTVPELAQRRADHLTKKMVEVNEPKKLVRRTPTEVQVAAWIESARGLPRVVTY
jgi:predicted flap endonuclease-1-like 5' DNA nuclease